MEKNVLLYFLLKKWRKEVVEREAYGISANIISKKFSYKKNWVLRICHIERVKKEEIKAD